MIRFLFQKMLHKKWLIFSLFIGNILLVAIAASHPMYKAAAIKRMFADDFLQFTEEENRHVVLKVGVSEFPAGVHELARGRKDGSISDGLLHKLGAQAAKEIVRYLV